MLKHSISIVQSLFDDCVFCGSTALILQGYLDRIPGDIDIRTKITAEQFAVLHPEINASSAQPYLCMDGNHVQRFCIKIDDIDIDVFTTDDVDNSYIDTTAKCTVDSSVDGIAIRCQSLAKVLFYKFQQYVIYDMKLHVKAAKQIDDFKHLMQFENIVPLIQANEKWFAKQLPI
jgi:hypothetical protein